MNKELVEAGILKLKEQYNILDDDISNIVNYEDYVTIHRHVSKHFSALNYQFAKHVKKLIALNENDVLKDLTERFGCSVKKTHVLLQLNGGRLNVIRNKLKARDTRLWTAIRISDKPLKNSNNKIGGLTMDIDGNTIYYDFSYITAYFCPFEM